MRMWLWIVAFGVWGTAVSAHAQSDDERARKHFESGSSYYDQARYAEAAREFEASYALSPHPELLLNISRAEERALNYDGAIAAAERYLGTNPKAEDKRTVEERIAGLRVLKQRYEQGGPEPLPPPGSDPTLPPVVATGATGATTPPTAAKPPPTAASLGASAAAAAPAPPAAPPESGNRFTVPAIVLMGTGGAALVASLVTGLVAHADYKSLVRQCDGNDCPPEAEDELDEGKTLSVVSTVLTVVGVLAAGTGGALLVLGAQNEEPAPAPRPGQVRFAPGATPASLRATLTF